MRQRTTGFCIRTGVGLAVLFFSLVLLFTACVSAEEKVTDDKAEWTVMMYFCGSDLESNHSMATFNMLEMKTIEQDFTMQEFLNLTYDEEDQESDPYKEVNVILETGGCKKWKNQLPGEVGISADKLQRWSFQPSGADPEKTAFTLVEDLPLVSMSEPATLSDFIRWGAKNYPAEKYALVLWDHGGGAMGLFVDELFDKDILRLDELETAMNDGGVHFEAVILDACMMANLETAKAISAHASYMVASEEVTSGYGSAFGDWLQELYRNPQRDGRQLGICICDLTVRKYTTLGIARNNDLLTYSVLDLSHLDKVVEGFDRLFEYVDKACMEYPQLLTYWARMIYEAERYGSGNVEMIDIGSLLYNDGSVTLLPAEARSALQNALNDCICYCVHGEGRAGATGLSFCLAVNMDEESMDVYSRCCVSPYYLAYLDSISTWDASDSLYEKVPRIKSIDGEEIYRFDVKIRERDGFPAAAVPIDQMAGVGRAQYYEIYYRDENADEYLDMRRDECEMYYDEEMKEFLFVPVNPRAHATIEGLPCVLELVKVGDLEDFYNIPFKMNNDIYNFRCGYLKTDIPDFTESRYTVYGIWNGYDSDTGMSNRNVVTMSDYQGRDYRLLYPVSDDEKHTDAIFGESKDLTMMRNIDVEENELPAGDYAIRYVFTDVHGREIPQEMIYYSWDGNTFTIEE